MMTQTRTPPQFQNIVQPVPAAKPTSDASTNGQTSGTLSMRDWVKADQAWKESQPQTVSNGGQGVSN
jgi:hypothetical protein